MPAITRTRALRWLLAFAGAALLLFVTAPVASAAPVLPSKDSFYTYSGSTPLSTIAPGTVLKTRNIPVVIKGVTTPYHADQVLYRTTGEQGQATATVATIIKPLVPVPLNATKIVAYQTAYDALGSQCDPSYTLAGGNSGYSTAQSEALLITTYLDLGYNVVVSDYEGTALHWAAGQESGYGTLDGIRAAEQHLKLPKSTPVGMLGYSGGSIATEWASELAPSYAPELKIVGVAEGGIPVDFAHNLNYVNGSKDWSGVIPAVLVSLSRAFGIDLDQYLSAYGKTVTTQVHDQCINDFLGAYPGLTVQQLLKPQYHDFLKIPAFVTVINKLIMGSTPGHPAGPLLIAVGNKDGTGDGVMIAKDVEALAHEYCSQGVKVVFTEFQGADHTTAAAPFEGAAQAFLNARFLGTPAVDGCALIGTGNSLAPLPMPANHPPTSSSPTTTTGTTTNHSAAGTPLANTGVVAQQLSLVGLLFLALGAGLLWAARPLRDRSGPLSSR